MTSTTRYLRDQRGFTLAELLVATAVISVVLAGVFAIQRGGQQTYQLGASRVETQQNARVALELMTRELRSATSITAVGGASDVTFVDQTGQTIRYELSGSTLNRTIAGVTTPLIGGVQGFTMTYYSVYDVYNGTYTTTATPSAVRVIKIGVLTRTEKTVSTGSAGDQQSRMESTVMLRSTLS